MIGLVEVVYIESSFKGNTIEYLGSFMDYFGNISRIFDFEKSTKRSVLKKIGLASYSFLFF